MYKYTKNKKLYFLNDTLYYKYKNHKNHKKPKSISSLYTIYENLEYSPKYNEYNQVDILLKIKEFYLNFIKFINTLF
jgi:hypothetical protein